MSEFGPATKSRRRALALMLPLAALLLPVSLGLSAKTARADVSAFPVPAWPGLPKDDFDRMSMPRSGCG